MAKTPVKKTVKKTKTPIKKVELLKFPEYKVEVRMNDTVHIIETDNIETALLSISPFNIKTRVHFIIWKGDKKCEKLTNAFEAKQIFRNKLYMFIFIKRLIFK